MIAPLSAALASARSLIAEGRDDEALNCLAAALFGEPGAAETGSGSGPDPDIHPDAAHVRADGLVLYMRVLQRDGRRAEALQHGWRAIERVSTYEMALAARARGDLAATLELLRSVPAAEDDAADVYDISLRAHRLRREVLELQGQHDAAQAYEAGYAKLAARRAARRGDLSRLLPLGDSVLDALAGAEAERARVDAEIGRLRQLAAASVPRIYVLQATAASFADR